MSIKEEIITMLDDCDDKVVMLVYEILKNLI